MNAATPLAIGNDQLFLTASYRIGAKLIAVDQEGKVQARWQSDNAMSSQYPTPIFDGQFLYGIHGREDGPLAALRCLDAQTGRVQWSQDGTGMAHLILADDKLLMLKTSGELVLLAKNPRAYQELGSMRVSRETTRALPALASGRLLIRDVEGKLAAWSMPGQ